MKTTSSICVAEPVFGSSGFDARGRTAIFATLDLCQSNQNRSEQVTSEISQTLYRHVPSKNVSRVRISSEEVLGARLAGKQKGKSQMLELGKARCIDMY